MPPPALPDHVPRPRRLRDPRPDRPPLRARRAGHGVGVRTSPTSRPVRAGCTWRRCSISAPAGCSATRWPTTCAPSSSSTPSAWPSPPAAAPVAGVIGHADRGSQYTSNDYLEFCHAHQMRPSVGRTGVCWDNAVAESFWESLKRECLQGPCLRHPRRSPPGDLPLDQLVQHDPAAHQPQQRPTHRVGTAVPSSVITTRPADGEMARTSSSAGSRAHHQEAPTLRSRLGQRPLRRHHRLVNTWNEDPKPFICTNRRRDPRTLPLRPPSPPHYHTNISYPTTQLLLLFFTHTTTHTHL